MIKTENIIKSLSQELKTLYPTYKFYIGNLEEKAEYPCFLIYLGLENARGFDTELNRKTLTVDIVYFNSNRIKNNTDYLQKIKVKDNLEGKLLNKNYLVVNKNNVKFEYNIGNADDLLNITLKLTYFNSIIKESINYELIQEIIYNNEIT